MWKGGIWCNCDAYRKQVDDKQLYNQVPQTAWVSWSSRQAELEFELPFQLEIRYQRENQLADEGLGPSGPRLSSPAEWGRSAAIIQRNLASICCSLFPSPTHLSHITNINPFATLSRIKCKRYIFLKKCVRTSLLLIVFPHVYVYV